MSSKISDSTDLTKKNLQPQNKLKLIPEFENYQACLILWPHEKSGWEHCDLPQVHLEVQNFIELVCQVGKQKVHVVFKNESNRNEYQAQLPDEVKTHVYPYRDVWLRDIGPLNVRDTQGKTFLFNPQFNAWGAKYEHDLDKNFVKGFLPHVLQGQGIYEGGALETNGEVLLVNESCFDQAREYKNFIDAKNLLEKTFDLKICSLNTQAFEGDDTDGHIDTLMRFVSPTKLVADKRLENRKSFITLIDELKKSIENLEILILPSCDYQNLPATYANFYFASPTTILLPCYERPEDKEAQQALEKFTGFQVILTKASYLVKQFGSWHCFALNIFNEESFYA